jgi:hypothetical protein
MEKVTVKKTIIIHLLSNGKVEVNGELWDKIACYGLLEAAKEAVKEYVNKPQRVNGKQN